MAARTDADPAPPPGVLAALRRSRTLRVAAVVWILLVALLVLLDETALQVPGWFAKGIVILLLPAVVLFVLVALPLLPFASTRRAGIAMGAALATLVAALWALVIGLGVWLGGSPYALIPPLDPDSVAGFARRHPALSVSTTLTVDTTVRDGAGRALVLRPSEVSNASFAFEACDPPPLADRLGGLPPPPAALACAFRYRMARDGEERVVYVYERRRVNSQDWTTLPGGAELPYDAWARTRGAKPDEDHPWAARGGTVYTQAQAGGRSWLVRQTRYPKSWHRLLIAEGGGPIDLPPPGATAAASSAAASAPP